MTGTRVQSPSFEAHIRLLRAFLVGRELVVARIEGIVNAQRKPIDYLQDRALLFRLFEDCFFAAGALTDDQVSLKGRLQEAHWASGFKPRQVPGLANDLIHPAEMMVRGFFFWQRTRWPGRNGRRRFAQTLFNVYLLRCLAYMSVRIWDAGFDGAGERLAQLQALLDDLWRSSPRDQPKFVRDARWLIPFAQSPTTDELAGYFQVAERVAAGLGPADRLEVQRAGVRMVAGHLTSQARHYCLQDEVSIDEASVVRRTRTSNALDFALLVQGLVSLLEAYESARVGGDESLRLQMAGAICQGISPDPEVFLNRVDLLGAYSMVEHLFVATTEAGEAVYTPMGERHLRLLREYAARIGPAAGALLEDCANFKPVAGAYSPYGAIYGTPSNLAEDMALKTLDDKAPTMFALEDVFTEGGADKLDWVDGWKKLPHISQEVQRLYDYPQQFAASVFARIERELRRRALGQTAEPATGRLVVGQGDQAAAGERAAEVAPLPIRYIVSSDSEVVAAGNASAYEPAKLLHDRLEGHFVLSYESTGGWVAIKKDMLTEVLGAGRDAILAGLPRSAASVLRLTCPGLVRSSAR